MASFCTKCGSALGQGAQFCVQCGTPVAAAPAGAAAGQPAARPTPSASPAPPAYAAPAPPVRQQGSSTAVKIVLAILGFFVLVGCLGVGSCLYVGYRFKQRAGRFAQSTPYRGMKDPCRLVTQSEVSDALGVPVQAGTALGDRSCQFGLGPSGALLNYDVTWEGGTMAMKIMTMALKAKGDASTAMSSIPGLGDEAYVGPMGMGIFMRKGDVLVMISSRGGPFDLEGAKKIAAIIATRI